MTHTLVPCPVGRAPEIRTDAPPCGTMLQPYRGRMTDGIAQHLHVVHGVPLEAARSVATYWIQRGARAPR